MPATITTLRVHHAITDEPKNIDGQGLAVRGDVHPIDALIALARTRGLPRAIRDLIDGLERDAKFDVPAADRRRFRADMRRLRQWTYSDQCRS